MQPFGVPLLILLLSLGGIARAETLSLPPTPVASAYPTPEGYLRFFATSVSRMKDGTSLVQYGYLFGRLDGHVLMVMENQDQGLVCHGETGRKEWPADRSVVTCTKHGKKHSHSVMKVEGKRSKAPIGSITSPIRDDAGRIVGESILQWNPFRFPKAK